MTYRVGEAGAVVFDEEGHAIAQLRPGYVVVPGSLKTPGSLADQHRKRVRNYADKSRQAGRDYEDKGA
jgi:hypothetical protein